MPFLFQSRSGSGVSVSGSRGAPVNVTAGGGISPGADTFQKIYIQGSGGAVTVTANPQVAAGTTDGQRLILVGRSDTNTVTLANGTGLSLNGDITLGDDDTLDLSWDGTSWCEVSRRR